MTFIVYSQDNWFVNNLTFKLNFLVSFLYHFKTFFVSYITIIDFGWITHYLGISINDVYATLKPYVKETYKLSTITFFVFGIFHIILTKIIITLSSVVLSIFFKDNWNNELGIKKDLKKLDKLYSIVTSNESNLTSEKIKKNNKDLKNLKEKLLKWVEKTKNKEYDLYVDDYKAFLDITLSYQDSITANRLSSIINENFLNIIKQKERIHTVEEFNKFIKAGFKPFQIEVLNRFNFRLDGNKKKLEGDNNTLQWQFKQNKLYMFKLLCVVYFFKNYPLHIVSLFLEKKNIKFSNKEKDFILDLPYYMLFPSLKEKDLDNLIKDYSNFIDIYMKDFRFMKTITIQTSEKNQEFEDKKAAELLYKALYDFKKKMKEIFIREFKFIYKRKGINIKNNFEICLSDNIDLYLPVNEEMNYNELSLVVAILEKFDIKMYYTLLNKTLKDMRIYKNLKPYYLETYLKLKVRDTFLYMNRYSNKYQQTKFELGE